MQLSFPLLCLVTDRLRCNGRPLEDVVDAAVEGGVRMVQLREKDLPAADLYALSLRIKDVAGNRALLFINDRVDLALAVKADGVQLGETALPIEVARQILGRKMLLARSVHSVAGALDAETRGADLLTLGTVFPTASHPGAYTGGLSLIREVSDAVSVPFLGIGGIDSSNTEQVIAAGASGAAVITAITAAEDPSDSAAVLLQSMRAASLQSPVRAS